MHGPHDPHSRHESHVGELARYPVWEAESGQIRTEIIFVTSNHLPSESYFDGLVPVKRVSMNRMSVVQMYVNRMNAGQLNVGQLKECGELPSFIR